MALNPYLPADVVPPQFFAGRKAILEHARELAENALRGIHGGLLVSGHRGMGKTSALRAAEAQLPEGVKVVRLRFSREATLAEFAREVAGHLRTEGRSWRSRVGVKEVQVPLLTIRMEPRTPEERTPQMALFETLRALRKVDAVWLTLDDMDWVEGDALTLLKSAMEEAGAPTMVIAVAGGPQVRERLVSQHSPIIRFFTGSDFSLGHFTTEETAEALELPLGRGKARARWTREAVAQVHRWTGGYPYLVQCMGHAAFREGTIDRARVDGSMDDALRLASTWMDQELRTASDKDVALFDRIGRSGRNEWRSVDLAELGAYPVYVKRLERLGVLQRVERGRYIVVKAPMIARYLMWKRRLDAGPM